MAIPDPVPDKTVVATPPGRLEMAGRIRAFDWPQTPLGPIQLWPPSLRTAVQIMLDSRYPMFVWWGAELTSLYNDHHSAVHGNKHPHALGKSAREVWAEVWDILGPQTETVLRDGNSTWNEEILLPLERHGFPEETYFTFSYSPIRDESGAVLGLFGVCTEDTARVLGRRRLKTLRDLGDCTLPKSKGVEQAVKAAVDTLATNPQDIPFGLVYVLDELRIPEPRAESLVVGTPSAVAEQLTQSRAANLWQFAGAVDTPKPYVVQNLSELLGAPLKLSACPEPVEQALVVPLASPAEPRAAGFLVAGLNPRIAFDAEYRSFLELAAGHIGTAIANARAFQQERRRAEALAEIDRAKTAFFSNVSHEFRTPLTLMLGPVEDLLSRSPSPLSPAVRSQLELTHRNGLRLLRLVNTLLDFSRMEAGRVQAVFEPVDLAAVTAELASVFRAATERAGLALTVDCRPLPEPVYVDREMWENIVLNLISNAFKFTFDGGITVTVRAVEGAAELEVRDTGVGIPREEMPRLFERFHRVLNMRSRTHEGSGIGLALVQELVKLHGGSVRADSRVGEGTVFTVSIPFGKSHLPPEHLEGTRPRTSTSAGAAPFVEEALRWLPDEAREPDAPPSPAAAAREALPRVLVADDNADMRQYLVRLLSEHYQVQTVPDGHAALAAANARRPDLILSDIMMPRLDGLGLLRELRANPSLRTVPVILLSARAGEESRVEGLRAGADDYLIKPFSARELLARLASNLELARVRGQAEQAIRDSEKKYRLLFENMTEVFQVLEPIFDEQGKPVDFRYIEVNEASEKLTGIMRKDMEGRRANEVWGGVEDHWLEMFGKVLRTGEPARMENYSAELHSYYDVYAWKVDERRVAIVFSDITERKKAQAGLRHRTAELDSLLANAPLGFAFFDREHRYIQINQELCRINGLPEEAHLGHRIVDVLPVNAVAVDPILERVFTQGVAVEAEVVGETPKEPGVSRHWLTVFYPVKGEGAEVLSVGAVVLEITDRKRAEQALRESEERFRAVAETVPALLYVMDASGLAEYASPRCADFTGLSEEQLLGEPWLSFVHPDDVAGYQQAWENAVVSGMPFEAQIRFRRYDGVYRWFLARAYPLRNEPGRVSKWFGLATDIEEQKQTEKALRIANEDLNQFAYAAAHDLREPLRNVRAFSELLVKSYRDTDDRVAEIKTTISEGVQRMDDLLNDLLDYTRVVAPAEELTGTAHTRAALDKALRNLDAAIRASGAEVIIGELPPVVAIGEAHLVQLFQNLIGNAVQYRSEQAPRITVSAEQRHSDWVLSVRDNGIGIAPEYHRKIFGLFKRLHGKEIPGTGLGLALCQKIVERYGGRIWVESEVGMGAAFFFTI